MELAEIRLPFVFMNAVGRDGDVWTLLHESGHAFHVFAVRDKGLPYQYRAENVPLEIAEVASQAMEIIGGEHLEGTFYNKEDAARSKREHLASIVKLLAWIATIVLALLATIATFSVQPAIIASFGNRPWEIIFPLLALAGLAGIGYYNVRQRDLPAFFSSGAFILGMFASTASGLYPMVLPAVTRANSLTINNASGSQYGQTVGLVWWSIGIVLAATYFILTYRLFWGKVHVTDTEGY